MSAALATTDGREWRRLQRAEVTAAGLRTCYLDRPSTLRAPTLYVHGERDPLVPSSWSVRAAAMTPEVLANCGHWPPRERPERVSALLSDYFAPGQ